MEVSSEQTTWNIKRMSNQFVVGRVEDWPGTVARPSCRRDTEIFTTQLLHRESTISTLQQHNVNAATMQRNVSLERNRAFVSGTLPLIFGRWSWSGN
jgi:hypothetical protein